MVTATAELPRVPEKETGGEIVVTDRRDENFRKEVAAVAQSYDPTHTPERATPSAEVPIPQTPELNMVGAERVGSQGFDLNEEVEFKTKDAKHGVAWLFKKIMGGGSKIRHASGSVFSKFKREKALKESSVIDKHDPSQLDIE